MKSRESSKLVRNAEGLYVQFSALPVRASLSGKTEVMLISSRETRRWIFPKGWPISGKAGPETAGIEAFEEAGLEGLMARQPLGHYRYNKLMRGGSLSCEVTVFLMLFHAQRSDWPERSQRTTRWFSCSQAKERVQEKGLAALIARIPTSAEELHSFVDRHIAT